MRCDIKHANRIVSQTEEELDIEPIWRMITGSLDSPNIKGLSLMVRLQKRNRPKDGPSRYTSIKDDKITLLLKRQNEDSYYIFGTIRAQIIKL